MPFPIKQSRLVAAVWIVTCCSNSAYADAVQRFFAEYPAAALQIEKVYGKCSINVIEVDRDNKPAQTVNYKAGHDEICVETREDGKNDVSFVAGRTRYFVVTRKAGAIDYSLNRLTGQAPPLSVEPLRLRSMLPFASYCQMEFPVIDLMHLPGFKVKQGSVTQEEGKEVLRIDWEWTIPGKRGEAPMEQVGWFEFDTAHSWVLLHSAFAYDKKATGRIHTVLTYEGSHDGVPLVQSLERYSENKGAKFPRDGAVVQDIKMEEAEETNFTLSHYGIPDPLGPMPKSSFGLATYLLAGGFAGLLVSLLLAAKINRRTPRAA